jgi:serine/threonine-protein kinase
MDSALSDITGRMLDRRYEVRSRIAHGGMATVYLATDTRLDREVALKVMHAELARDADFVARFIGEAKSAAKLSHPNIVAVYDQGSDEEFLYLAMEYVPGRTLRELLRERGWLPWQEALSVIDPVLAGLAAAHRAGVVHRDVKPENVLLTDDGRVKVVDFGLARATAAVGNTRAGQIIGSVNYIAPEQVTGSPTDARTDVYSAGIMLFEMLTGRQPFTGESPLAIAYQHVNEDVPAVGTLIGGVPAPVEQLVGSATSRDPGLRPANAAVFMQASRALRGLPAPAEEVPPTWATAAFPAGSHGTGSYPSGGLGLAEADGNSHTMVVGPEYAGYDAPPPSLAGRVGGAFATLLRGSGNHAGSHGADTAPPAARPGAGFPGAGRPSRDPFLTRWLFSYRIVYVLAALLVGFGVVGGGWYLTTGRYAPVPSVANLTSATAVSTLQEAGFKVKNAPSVIDDNVPKGEVIGTSPSGKALPGATITVTVSLGPKMITVPPIPSDDSVSQAMAILRKAGLNVTSKAHPVGVPSNPQIGAIAGTTPAAGTSWPENKPVTVNVVEGLGVPDLIGQNIQDVQNFAGQDGLNIQPTQVNSSKPQGTILSQSPQPNTIIQQGQQTTINVTVSNGGPQIMIPNVQGQSCSQAQQTIQQAGFSNVTQQQGFFGGNTVSGTNPGEGSMQQAATPITVQCGSGFGFGFGGGNNGGGGGNNGGGG